ncbi:MAG: lysophospholipase L1-like esterase [Candidatus Latescibacterota bacterium]|jgi:lysophospholipase L1-like esterase
MKLETTIPLHPERNQIDYNSKVLLLGSCFAENIGRKLDYFKFQDLVNPFGIIFHPAAIERLVIRAINKEVFTPEDIFFQNERWHCYEVHSDLSASTEEALLGNLNTALERLDSAINSASHIVFTFGTAWVYRHIASDTVVANCHKVSQKQFLKELLSVEEVSASIDSTITLIQSVNTAAVFIGTISPVRHIKDGIAENARSKAHLLAGLHELIEPKKGIHYFPSYELMMDQLRDYRFYSEDLIHPNKTAIEIIWEAFSEVWIDQNTSETQKEIGNIQTGLAHRPFNPKSESHQLFLVGLQNKITTLQERFPHVAF